MTAVLGPMAVAVLACGVLWLAQRTCRAALRPQEGEVRFTRMLLILFAWSFVLGAVMRWARLTS